jgi:hypothetical protein
MVGVTKQIYSGSQTLAFLLLGVTVLRLLSGVRHARRPCKQTVVLRDEEHKCLVKKTRIKRGLKVIATSILVLHTNPGVFTNAP